MWKSRGQRAQQADMLSVYTVSPRSELPQIRSGPLKCYNLMISLLNQVSVNGVSHTQFH